MNLLNSLKEQKRYRYLLHFLVVTISIFIYSLGKIKFDAMYLAVLTVFLVFLGALLTQFPSIDYKNVLYILINPISVISGALMFYNFFPNLGIIFKTLSVVVFGIFYYLVSLVDNVFLVIHDREEVIPLYRAAAAWSQIMQVIVAIPLFSGIFKLNINGIYQSVIVGVISFIYVVYQIWTSRYDKDSKSVRVGEEIFLASLGFFVVTAISTVVTFVPTEAFFRALLVAVVLMFVLSYVASYLRNDINRKMMVQFTLLFCIFLVLVLVF